MKTFPAQSSLTPETIAGGKTRYSIPMYQRLFEWREPAIEGLLADLKSSMTIKGKDAAYYIGMLTSTAENELVDGQQRFSVMTLIGIMMAAKSGSVEVREAWTRFLLVDPSTPRIYYEARDEDNAYLRWKLGLGESTGYDNTRMTRGLEAIGKFLDEEFSTPEDMDEYCMYVFKHLTVFISVLPEAYKAKALNKYFEAMNSTGKNLENHEILKVDILKKLSPDCDEVKFTRIWNAVADMDKLLIRKREWNHETDSQCQDRYRKCFSITKDIDTFNVQDLFNDKEGSSLLNDLTNTNKALRSDALRIADIRFSENEDVKKPEERRLSEGYRSMLSFSEFLLQVLYLVSPPDESVNVTDFFDTNLLNRTFEDARKKDPSFSSEKFIRALLHYRILYDYFCIRIANKSEDYKLEMMDGDSESEEKRRVIMYESMLHVASSSKSYYLWVSTLLSTVSDKPGISFSRLLKVLKDRDNEIREWDDLKNPGTRMTYEHIDRYWFWRLDYHLWENRETLFRDDSYLSNFSKFKKLVDKYTFKRSRSIEHVSPQHPEGMPPIKKLDNFGNLVMISSSFNSKLSNSSYHVKRGYIEDCEDNIESLSMILLYSTNDIWGDEQIGIRQAQMLRLLMQSREG